MRLEIQWRSGRFEVVDMATQPVTKHGRFHTRAEAREVVRSLMFPLADDQQPSAPKVVESAEPQIIDIKPEKVVTAKKTRKKTKKSAKRSK